MPLHLAHGTTPESLVARADSKNPSTTCAGLTSSGRPCRRALAASPKSLKKPAGLGGVVAILEDDEGVTQADFYCWQHKDQAQSAFAQEAQNGVGGKDKRRSFELVPLKERSSIDTMVQRLGLDAEEPEGIRRPDKKKTSNPQAPKRTETRDFAMDMKGRDREKHGRMNGGQRQSQPKRASFWGSLCCMTNQDDDYVKIVRHRKRIEQQRTLRQGDSTINMGHSSTPPRARASKPSNSRRPSHSNVYDSHTTPNGTPNRRIPVQREPSSPQTQRLLSLIPQHLSPQTASALLAELVKPISVHDEEGYIYIFWLTPQSKQPPTEATARSLLLPPNSKPANTRRISDVMSEYSSSGIESETPAKKTIMLKIGRANNVTRRMNEWQRQCGYELNLVRWYPHVPSSSSPQPSPRHAGNTGTMRRESEGLVRRVSCVKRVERLIHLELHDQQVKRQCEVCGKEHREWFEVEASQAGVRTVDECVRRWVGWAETQQASV